MKSDKYIQFNKPFHIVLSLLLFVGIVTRDWLVLCLEESGKKHIEISSDIHGFSVDGHLDIDDNRYEQSSISISTGEDHGQPHIHNALSSHYTIRNADKSSLSSSNIDLPVLVAMAVHVPQYVSIVPTYLLPTPPPVQDATLVSLRTIILLV